MNVEGIYWNSSKIMKKKQPFNIIIGGRGTGKTYEMLKFLRNTFYEGCKIEGFLDIEPRRPFIYIRRLESTIKSLSTPKKNPYKKLNEDFNWDITCYYNEGEKMGGFIDNDTGDEIGYIAPLPSFAKMRGSDLSDVDILLYDEFIKEPSEKVVSGECDSFLHAYETVGRNREIVGLKPLLAVLLSNATDIESPLLANLGIIPILEQMKRKGYGTLTIPERALHIELLKDLPIIEMKKDTALAKLTKGTKFYEHTFNNEFSYNNFDNIMKMNLKNYKPCVKFENIYIYLSKDKSMFYATYSSGDFFWKFTQETVNDFKRRFGLFVGDAIFGGRMIYESYEIKMLLQQIWKPQKLSV